MAHAGAGLQHGHVGLDAGCSHHLVGHAGGRREEIQAVLALAHHGTFEHLHPVGFLRLLAQRDELAQRSAELGRRLQAHASQRLAALGGALELPGHRHLGAAAVGPAHLLHQFRAKVGIQRDALVAVACPQPACHRLARAHDDGPLPALDVPRDGLPTVAAASNGALGTVLRGEACDAASRVAGGEGRYLAEIAGLLRPGGKGVRHVIGHSHDLIAQLLGALHFLQLPAQAGQVRTEGRESRELGVVGRLGVGRLALALLLLGVGRVLRAQLVALGGGHVGLQQFDLSARADAVQELGSARCQRLRHVAHRLGHGLQVAGPGLGGSRETGAACGVGLALQPQTFLGVGLHAISHFGQPLGRRLAAVVRVGVAAFLGRFHCGGVVAAGQGHEGLRLLARGELEARDGAAAAVATVVAADALGASVQGVVILAAHALGQAHHEQVRALLGVLGGDDVAVNGLPGHAHLRALLVGAAPALAAALGSRQVVKRCALLGREHHSRFLERLAARHRGPHPRLVVVQGLGVFDGVGHLRRARHGLVFGGFPVGGILRQFIGAGGIHHRAHGILLAVAAGHAVGIAAAQGVA